MKKSNKITPVVLSSTLLLSLLGIAEVNAGPIETSQLDGTDPFSLSEMDPSKNDLNSYRGHGGDDDDDDGEDGSCASDGSCG